MDSFMPFWKAAPSIRQVFLSWATIGIWNWRKTDYSKRNCGAKWKGKQKVLRLSDLVLIDLAMPRGYASFHVLDVWRNRAFLSDEKDKLVLCEMTLE